MRVRNFDATQSRIKTQHNAETSRLHGVLVTKGLGQDMGAQVDVLLASDKILEFGRGESSGFCFRIFRVSGFDHDKKFVMRRQSEASVLEQRMMQAR